MTAKARPRKGAEEPGFEEAVARLEEIVKELEGPDVPLEKALEMFEEGVRLSRICHRKLSEAEKKVKVLTRGEAGELGTEPFEEEGEEEEAGEEDEGSSTLF